MDINMKIIFIGYNRVRLVRCLSMTLVFEAICWNTDPRHSPSNLKWTWTMVPRETESLSTGPWYCLRRYPHSIGYAQKGYEDSLFNTRSGICYCKPLILTDQNADRTSRKTTKTRIQSPFHYPTPKAKGYPPIPTAFYLLQSRHSTHPKKPLSGTEGDTRYGIYLGRFWDGHCHGLLETFLRSHPL